jgi:hypothetical protein
VLWPLGKEEVLTGVTPGKHVVVREPTNEP